LPLPFCEDLTTVSYILKSIQPNKVDEDVHLWHFALYLQEFLFYSLLILTKVWNMQLDASKNFDAKIS